MSKRRINLEKYGISAHRRDEQLSFTLQYPEWQARLRELRGLSAVRTDSEAVQGGSPGNPTESAALRTVQYVGKVETVERAVRRTIGKDEGLYVPLLRAVTQGLTYEAANVPVGQKLFYTLLAAYYVNLDRDVDVP